MSPLPVVNPHPQSEENSARLAPPHKKDIGVPLPTPVPDQTGQDSQSNAGLENLRNLRGEFQDLQIFLSRVQTGEIALSTFVGYVEKTHADIVALLNKITGGESVRHIINVWEQMIFNPIIASPAESLDAQSQLHYLSLLDEQFNDVIFWIGYLTIPNRLDSWLKESRPGYYIPFHLIFENEVPLLKDRMRILNYIAWAPNELKNGLVDTANGLIYRYSERASSRWLSLLWVILGLAVSTGLVAGAAFIRMENWPFTPASLPTLLVGWVLLLVGIIVHIAVGSVKRTQQSGGLPPILALGDILRVIDARVGQILLKFLTALVGFFGLVFAAGIVNLTTLNAFLVGYTLDSFVELFGASLEQQANTQLTLMRQQLKVE